MEIADRRFQIEGREMEGLDWSRCNLAEVGPLRHQEKIKSSYPSSHSLRGRFEVRCIQSMLFQEIIEISPVLARQLGCLAYISFAHL